MEGEGRSLLNLSSFPHRAGVLAKESGNERALSVEGQDAVWSAPGALTSHNSLEGQCDPVAHPYAKGTHKVP